MDTDLKLHDAINSNDIETVRMLLENGADPNGILRYRDEWDDHDNEIPMLCYAIICTNSREMVKLLLEFGADANSCRTASDIGFRMYTDETENYGGYTVYPALEDAIGGNGKKVSKADPEIIRLLLEHGADPNIRGYTVITNDDGEELERLHGMPMLSCTVRDHENTEIVKMLLQYGADVNAGKGHHNVLYNALDSAYWFHFNNRGCKCEAYEEIVKLLLENGADTYFKLPYKETPYEITNFYRKMGWQGDMEK